MWDMVLWRGGEGIVSARVGKMMARLWCENGGWRIVMMTK